MWHVACGMWHLLSINTSTLNIDTLLRLRTDTGYLRFTSVQTAVVRLWVETQRWSRVGADLRRAVVSIDEIDGQKQGSAPCAVNNHTKRNSTGRKFINTNDTLLRLRTDIGYLPERTEGMEDNKNIRKQNKNMKRNDHIMKDLLLAV